MKKPAKRPEDDPYRVLGIRPDEELVNNPLVKGWNPFRRKGK